MKTQKTKGMSGTPTVLDKICLALKGLLFPTLRTDFQGKSCYEIRTLKFLA